MEAGSTLLRQFLCNLSNCIFSEAKPSRRFFGIVLAVLFTALLLIMLCLGAAPIRNGAWDVVILLNGGWRIVSGQIPHTDYHNPLGALTYLLVAFGMKVAGPSTAAIPYGIVLLTGCLLPLAWNIAASRFTPFLAFIYVLFNGFLLIAPHVLGLGMRVTTYAMIYNREGYVLISLLFVLLFLPRRKETGEKPVSDGLLAGFLLALIFYCKVTYLLVACASLPLVAIFSRPSWKWYISFAAAFIGVCGMAYIFFRIEPWAYIHDIVTSAHAQSTTERTQMLKDEIARNSLWVCLFFACLVLWTYVEKALGRSLWSSTDLWLIAGWIILASIGIDAGNTGSMADNPLFFTGCVVTLERFRRRNQEQIQVPMSQASLVQLSAYIIILPHFCFQILAHDTGAFAYAAAWDLVKRPSFDTSRQLHAEPLRDLRVPGEGHPLINPYWYNLDFPSKMNDGLDLLRKHLSANDRVTTFGYTDPFSFAFGLKPCRDANQNWAQTFSFNTNIYPAAEEFLGSATLVMVPIPDSRYSSISSQGLETMKGLYNSYLQTNFELVETSQAWVLYRRRSAPLEGVHSN